MPSFFSSEIRHLLFFITLLNKESRVAFDPSVILKIVVAFDYGLLSYKPNFKMILWKLIKKQAKTNNFHIRPELRSHMRQVSKMNDFCFSITDRFEDELIAAAETW
jgi:hypothetical protein